MKKLIFTLVFSFAFLNSIEANVAAIDNPIILTEKNDNPISGYEGSNKSSTFLYFLTSGMRHPKYFLRLNSGLMARCSSVRKRVLVCFC